MGSNCHRRQSLCACARSSERTLSGVGMGAAEARQSGGTGSRVAGEEQGRDRYRRGDRERGQLRAAVHGVGVDVPAAPVALLEGDYESFRVGTQVMAEWSSNSVPRAPPPRSPMRSPPTKHQPPATNDAMRSPSINWP